MIAAGLEPATEGFTFVNITILCGLSLYHIVTDLGSNAVLVSAHAHQKKNIF
jgi:hypothetical protein